MNDLRNFIDEVHHNDQLMQEVNQAGKRVTEHESDELRRNLAEEMSNIAFKHGYELEPGDFYGHINDKTFLDPTTSSRNILE